MAEGLYEGISTDRVLVSWKLSDYPPKKGRTEGIEKLPLVENTGDIKGDRFRLEIPYDLDGLKKSDLDAAKAFRTRTAAVFSKALKEGYQVKGFKALTDEKRSFYLFERE